MDTSPKAKDSKPTKPSPSELLSSAKVVAEAAKSDNVDKAKVAGAAADLLGAASHYGKLEDKAYGKIVEKAENYLHNYQSSNSAAPTSGDDEGTTGESNSASSDSTGDDGKSGSGYGQYLKMAGGMLNKKH